mmetsp:Transcript_11609/g.38281  ORF Transcript_11609/g.38281 Transcript_11609/m.38281 type:complete len:309 (+) Transcript_11609:1652-2578(+)
MLAVPDAIAATRAVSHLNEPIGANGEHGDLGTSDGTVLPRRTLQAAPGRRPAAARLIVQLELQRELACQAIKLAAVQGHCIRTLGHIEIQEFVCQPGHFAMHRHTVSAGRELDRLGGAGGGQRVLHYEPVAVARGKQDAPRQAAVKHEAERLRPLRWRARTVGLRLSPHRGCGSRRRGKDGVDRQRDRVDRASAVHGDVEHRSVRLEAFGHSLGVGRDGHKGGRLRIGANLAGEGRDAQPAWDRVAVHGPGGFRPLRTTHVHAQRDRLLVVDARLGEREHHVRDPGARLTLEHRDVGRVARSGAAVPG